MTEPTCPPCLLTQAERDIVNALRKALMFKRGGMVKAHVDKGGEVKITATEFCNKR